MKLLHNDKKLFSQILSICHEKYNLSATMIEKDYYVFVILRELTKRIPELVFKGGTSLSKCHKIIDRFSEDVDLSTDVPVTQGRRKQIKKILMEVINNLGLKIVNIAETHSRKDYNKYTIVYESVFKENNDLLTPTIVLELTYISTAVPALVLLIDSMVSDVLIDENKTLADEYSLTHSSIKVQSLERTLIDKVFALCDYCIRKEYVRNSRHIYDIYKIFPKVVTDKAFGNLVKEVRKIRQTSKVAVSAVDGVNINNILQEIVETECFKRDYEIITSHLIFDNVTYDEAIKVLIKIKDSKIFE